MIAAPSTHGDESETARELRDAYRNLGDVQTRCTNQLLEARTLRRALGAALTALDAAEMHDAAARVRAIVGAAP